MIYISITDFILVIQKQKKKIPFSDCFFFGYINVSFKIRISTMLTQKRKLHLILRLPLALLRKMLLVAETSINTLDIVYVCFCMTRIRSEITMHESVFRSCMLRSTSSRSVDHAIRLMRTAASNYTDPHVTWYSRYPEAKYSPAGMQAMLVERI